MGWRAQIKPEASGTWCSDLNLHRRAVVQETNGRKDIGIDAVLRRPVGNKVDVQ
jgi:hypothetical protein